MPLTRLSFHLPAGLAAMVLLSGCGNDSGGGGGRRGVLELVSHPKAPKAYFIDDPACQERQDTVSITKTQTQAWDLDQVVTRETALTGVKTGATVLPGGQSANALTSPAVMATRWGDRFKRLCDLDKGVDQACLDVDGREKAWDLDRASPGGFLRVCQDDHTYGRETYEGVALTSLNYLEIASRRYMQLAEATKPLPQVLLSVLPHFIDYYDNFMHEGERKRLETFITHNLAYFPGKTGMITVFPENIVDGVGATGFFWESEFVLAHEFGHHIDSARHGEQLAALGLRWNALTHSFDDLDAWRNAGRIISDRGQVLGAASEAYADILAYYTEGGTARSLVGLKELGVDRNVGGRDFASGDAKVLTEDRLSQLLTGERVVKGQGDEPSYTDIHIIGAIFAHTLDDVFAALSQVDPTVTGGSDGDLTRRYQLALAWRDAYMAELANPHGEDAAMPLAPLGRAIEKAVDGHLARFPLTDAPGMPTTREIHQDVCKQVAAALPAMSRAPFGAADAQANGGCPG